jgi:hypothetical protein
MMFIERLTGPQRQVVVLRYMLDLEHEQIAGVLDRTPEDVRALHSRAIRFLRARLEAVGRGPVEGGRVLVHRRVREARVLRSRRFSLLS